LFSIIAFKTVTKNFEDEANSYENKNENAKQKSLTSNT